MKIGIISVFSYDLRSPVFAASLEGPQFGESSIVGDISATSSAKAKQFTVIFLPNNLGWASLVPFSHDLLKDTVS